MTDTAGAPVVVGVDGSESALGAVRLAAREAAARNRPLRVVHALAWALVPVPLGPGPDGPQQGGLRNDAWRLVEDAVTTAQKAHPDLEVMGEVIDGAPATVLLGESRGAALVVLGNRGLGGFGGLVMGSVAVQVAQYARCPVLVARGEERSGGPVVVGVDGSEVSGRAVGFAFEEASIRGCELVAVHAYRTPVSTGPGDMIPVVYDRDALAEEESGVLVEATSGWSERYPDVRLSRRLVRERAAKALVEESVRAQLVVVGARGRGGFTGLLLGSVSHAVLHHANCPVAIIHR